ncbi:MAG TPA: HAD family hydrolase [Bacteroidia bacterium]|nr:HAD family hydrolase [Bacteroidia bacterium]
MWKIDKSWTLFLDRDGVINVRFDGDYVKNVRQFKFLPGVLGALARISKKFGRIIVVTNQQGIGKGIYTHEDLSTIHAYMKSEVEKAGGRIDAIYYAPDLAAENSPRRKPGIGMALQAKKDFPEIDFSKSVMAGDTESDMLFAQNAGMKAVYIGQNAGKIACDDCVADLPAFADAIDGVK